MQTYEQALSFSDAFTNQPSSAGYGSAFCQNIDQFLTKSFYQDLSAYIFRMDSVLPTGYGEIELILRKQKQEIHIFPSDGTFDYSGLDQLKLKGDLFYYEKTLKDIDYLVWVSVRCTINGDEGSASTVDSKFKRTVNYVPTYYLLSGGITTAIYHNDAFDWFLTADCSGKIITLKAGDAIKGVCPKEGGLYYYQITGVD